MVDVALGIDESGQGEKQAAQRQNAIKCQQLEIQKKMSYSVNGGSPDAEKEVS